MSASWPVAGDGLHMDSGESAPCPTSVTAVHYRGPGGGRACGPNHPEATATQATTCIQTATAAQSGMVTKVEVEEKSGQQRCEVGIVDMNGKKHRVQIDVGTNQVVKAK
jgi:hypothetical protein